jgi:hypothetical protein
MPQPAGGLNARRRRSSTGIRRARLRLFLAMREQLGSLPKLLPNAMGRVGKETDGERSDPQNVQINRGVPGCSGMGQDGAPRIWRPVL